MWTVTIAGAPPSTFSGKPGRSRVYYCLACKRDWARVECVLSDALYSRAWNCIAHKPADWCPFPGSILVDELSPALDDLPPDLLEREVLIHLYHSKEQSHG